MDLTELFKDKNLKPKEKTEWICRGLSDKTLLINELIQFASSQKDPVKATCMEALEMLTQKNPEQSTTTIFLFACDHLSSKAPRVKWESARVIGNTVHLHQADIEKALPGLIDNSTQEGTVVRWSAAYALSKIIILKTAHNQILIPLAENVIAKEEKNSIKKIYANAIKGLL